MTNARILTVLGCLYGAAGAGLMAAGTHGAKPLATTAGQMLLFHAAALVALAGALDAGRLHPALGRIGAVGLALGVAIFAADVALRVFAGSRLFPMAAPTGGSLTIISWTLLAIAAALGAGNDRPR